MRWRPRPVLGTTTMSLRRWSQKFARQPSATASTFPSIPTRHHPPAGKATRQHPQKASKPMRHRLQNMRTQADITHRTAFLEWDTGEQTRFQDKSLQMPRSKLCETHLSNTRRSFLQVTAVTVPCALHMLLSHSFISEAGAKADGE